MQEIKNASFHAYTAVALFLLLLLLISPSKTKAAESVNNMARPGCPDNCGGVTIPYPFGFGPNPNCFMSGFEVNCSNNGTSSTPYLGETIVLNINLSLGQTRVNMPVSYQCYNNTNKSNPDIYGWGSDVLTSSPYMFNPEKNKFVVLGGGAIGYLKFTNHHYQYNGGCISGGDSLESLINANGSCTGIGCCQTSIPNGTYIIEFSFDHNFSNFTTGPCNYAMLTDGDEFTFDTKYITTDKLSGQHMPALFDWAIANTKCATAQTNSSSFACISENSVCVDLSSGLGYICNCSMGYQGNPYLQGGCQDIDECANQSQCSKRGKCHDLPGSYKCSCPFGWSINNNICELDLVLTIGTTCAGIVALCFMGLGTCVVQERRKLSKIKEKYFQEHGGRILLEKIQSDQGCGITIFTKKQVEHATNNFDSANIIGHGGQGTVYKGILRDEMVAIKKCKIDDESKRKEFGKEMIILSQINHKNIVKLLGCCLEVEVPMLVYEFIPNGTLFHFIHGKDQLSHISLATRLSIAHESAEALAYLHSSASTPIFHGDVKSANILLDQNYTAKVSDFGASILAPTNEAQFVTVVQGTCGYLDPEYMQSCQLTDKSDVYSFGVVLLELLTRKPAIDFDALEEERSLSSCFLFAIKENKMDELLDNQIKREYDMQIIIKIVELAKECLNMKGEERPTMKEVAQELDQIQKLKQHPWGHEYDHEEIEILLGEASHEIMIGHTGYFNIDKEAEESIALGR